MFDKSQIGMSEKNNKASFEAFLDGYRENPKMGVPRRPEFPDSITKVTLPRRGFFPSHGELTEFLDNFAFSPHPFPVWLENVSPSVQLQTGEFDLNSRIKASRAQGLRLNEIQREILGNVGG